MYYKLSLLRMNDVYRKANSSDLKSYNYSLKELIEGTILHLHTCILL